MHTHRVALFARTATSNSNDSQTKPDTQALIASQEATGTQHDDASHVINDTQNKAASQHPLETHII